MNQVASSFKMLKRGKLPSAALHKSSQKHLKEGVALPEKCVV